MSTQEIRATFGVVSDFSTDDLPEIRNLRPEQLESILRQASPRSVVALGRNLHSARGEARREGMLLDAVAYRIWGGLDGLDMEGVHCVDRERIRSSMHLGKAETAKTGLKPLLSDDALQNPLERLAPLVTVRNANLESVAGFSDMDSGSQLMSREDIREFVDNAGPRLALNGVIIEGIDDPDKRFEMGYLSVSVEEEKGVVRFGREGEITPLGGYQTYVFPKVTNAVVFGEPAILYLSNLDESGGKHIIEIKRGRLRPIVYPQEQLPVEVYDKLLPEYKPARPVA